jgi:hypothetical protein
VKEMTESDVIRKMLINGVATMLDNGVEPPYVLKINRYFERPNILQQQDHLLVPFPEKYNRRGFAKVRIVEDHYGARKEQNEIGVW